MIPPVPRRAPLAWLCRVQYRAIRAIGAPAIVAAIFARARLRVDLGIAGDRDLMTIDVVEAAITMGALASPDLPALVGGRRA